jgi:hypothetical protein
MIGLSSIPGVSFRPSDALDPIRIGKSASPTPVWPRAFNTSRARVSPTPSAGVLVLSMDAEDDAGGGHAYGTAIAVSKADRVLRPGGPSASAAIRACALAAWPSVGPAVELDPYPPVTYSPAVGAG